MLPVAPHRSVNLALTARAGKKCRPAINMPSTLPAHMVAMHAEILPCLLNCESHLLISSNRLQGMDAMQGKLLRTRALWLVAVCGQDLPQELWQEAYAAAVGHMASPDLVVALTAVTAVLEQSHQVMEELQSTQQEHAMMQRTPYEEGAALPPGEVLHTQQGGGAQSWTRYAAGGQVMVQQTPL